MTNTNDAQRRVYDATDADTASFAPQGRHAAPVHDAASRPPAPAIQGADQAPQPQATGAMPAVASHAAPAHGAQQKRPAQTGVLPDLSASLPTLSVDDVQQQPVGAPVITFDHVTKVYPAQPNKPSLHDISLQIYAGEFVFLVGHSGSGKSTFIKLITRELKPTDGHIYIAGEDLSTMRNWRVPYLRRNIGCVFQDFKLLPNKTVFENVAFALEVIGKSRHVIKTQVPEVLRLVGLQDKLNKRPDQLSGGEQQRVSIARAIVNRPPLLVCDEPTGNLDPQTSRGIMDLLERINRTGTTVLVATHDREMVDNMRRRVIALDSGQLTRDQDRGVYGFDV
nr:cell division ATP-binding protein FtsE [uncultured Slackia sp.]